MRETLKFNPTKSIQERAKAKPGEEGALGPIDSYNRISYSISKPAFIISGIGTLIFPVLAPAAVITGVWAGSDKLQLEGSKWLRRKFKKGEMKMGQEVVLTEPESKPKLPSTATPKMTGNQFKSLPVAA